MCQSSPISLSEKPVRLAFLRTAGSAGAAAISLSADTMFRIFRMKKTSIPVMPEMTSGAVPRRSSSAAANSLSSVPRLMYSSSSASLFVSNFFICR